MDPPAAVPTTAPSNTKNQQNSLLPAAADTETINHQDQTDVIIDQAVRDPLLEEEEESKNADHQLQQQAATVPPSPQWDVFMQLTDRKMDAMAATLADFKADLRADVQVLIAQSQASLVDRLDASDRKVDASETKLDEITVTVQALQQAVDLQGDKQCDLEAHFVQDAQRIAVIEHARQEANQQPEPAIDLQLEMIYAVESPSTFSVPVFAENPMRDAAVAIAKTEPPNISDERAELFSTSIPSPEVLSNDICAIQQCYDEEKFTLSFPHVSNEPHEPGRILQPCLDTAATAVLINAELFNVVSSSAMWDPGGQSSFRPLRARTNNNRRRREKHTSSVWLFPPRQQASERLGQQGRGTTHSE